MVFQHQVMFSNNNCKVLTTENGEELCIWVIFSFNFAFFSIQVPQKFLEEVE